MKKFYSIVLMATALLIGTNAWGKTVSTEAALRAAIDAANAACSTVEITLDQNIDLSAPLQIYAPKSVYEANHLDLKAPNITLNLGGKVLTAPLGNNDTNNHQAIQLYKGYLKIVNGTIAEKTGSTGKKLDLICVYGSKDEEVGDWSTLEIGEGAYITSAVSPSGNAITIDGFLGAKLYKYYKGGAGLLRDLCDSYDTYLTNVYGTTNAISTPILINASETLGYWTIEPEYKAATNANYNAEYKTIQSFAFGAKVIVKANAHVYGTKYGIKINGNVRAKEGNVPQVVIEKDAEVSAHATNSNATAVYSSGYGIWTIQGNVHGSTGVYVKAGDVSVKEGAHIYSEGTNTGIAATGKASGIDGGGVAIAIEGNNSAYSNGGINVEISGGQIDAGTNGYAVQNANSDGTANPNAVTISGGEFEGGAAGCVTVESGVNVTLEGGTYTGDIATLVAAASDGDNIISQVVAQEGGQATVVIGKKETGDAVVGGSDIEFENDMSSAIVKLDATSANIAKTLPDGETVVKYLSLTGTGSYTSTVTVEAGKTLKVGQIVMNANGRLIVEAGATLVVTGSNGIFADNVENLVLETEEGNHSSFLLHPSVANNQHPKATVQFVSKAYYKSSSDYVNQRFGIPTIGALESITAEASGSPIATQIWGYFNGSWAEIGFLGTSFDPSKMDQPFAYYQMANDNPNRGTVVTMTGSLVGIADPKLSLTADGWSTFANSYMGNLTGSKMLDMFEGHNNVDMTLRSYVPTSASTFGWTNFNFANLLLGEEIFIEPMQAFIIKNNGAADQLQMSYKSMVWNPMFPSEAVEAPRRRVAAASDLTTARVEVRNAAGVYDYVTLLAGDQFTTEYNNGYDAEKIMNNTLDLYTVGAMNQATLATDNLDNTILGLNCAEAGTYTISFSHINGEELTLIDHATGARVAMVEGATYEFTAGENTENDYRFEIVGRANMPTAIENTEAVKSAKGVYTITGQYVGEMNVWNALPAGVYVVNGEKRVK